MSRRLTGRPAWYAKRLQRFLPGEIRWRLADELGKRWWRRRTHVIPVAECPAGRSTERQLAPVETGPALDALLAEANALLVGRLRVLGWDRDDLARPDWTGHGRVPLGAAACDLDGKALQGVSAKHVWELSRCHWATILGAAFHATGEERYAERCAELLRSWWSAHRSPSGLMWSSGVEMAMRLISWVWTRRLLATWPGVDELFADVDARRAVFLQQDYLARFPSLFSSGNNHQLSEAAGLVVAAHGFDWFDQSAHWRRLGTERLETVLANQVGANGVHREQAPDYHAFVFDLTLFATSGGGDINDEPSSDGEVAVNAAGVGRRDVELQRRRRDWSAVR